MNKLMKVAVFGLGKSGKSALRLARQKGYETFVVNQGRVEDWFISEQLENIIDKTHCFNQDDASELFSQMSFIVLSPGIPVSHPSLKLAHEKNVKIISEIEFAYQYVKDVPVIAITGTNGKTTTTTMIEEALTLAGKKVFCGGNIGIPYCDMVLSGEKFDYAVIEVSSFQLETIETFHPHIALLLNIFPNHTERYDSVYDYAMAKFRILMNMTSEDFLIAGMENPFLEELSFSPVKKLFFSKGNLPMGFKKNFSFNLAIATGEHNEANFFAAYQVLSLLKISNLDELFQNFINSFKGVAHRLEFVKEYQGLKIYNDAKSTNSLATSTAIRAFKEKSEAFYLILGGKLRNEADKILPDLVEFKNQITKVFLIGEVALRLEKELKNDFQIEVTEDLDSTLEKIKKDNLVGTLVFSPGFPSFDQFKNYVDRGEKFKEKVNRVMN